MHPMSPMPFSPSSSSFTWLVRKSRTGTELKDTQRSFCFTTTSNNTFMPSTPSSFLCRSRKHTDLFLAMHFAIILAPSSPTRLLESVRLVNVLFPLRASTSALTPSGPTSLLVKSRCIRVELLFSICPICLAPPSPNSLSSSSRTVSTRFSPRTLASALAPPGPILLPSRVSCLRWRAHMSFASSSASTPPPSGPMQLPSRFMLCTWGVALHASSSTGACSAVMFSPASCSFLTSPRSTSLSFLARASSSRMNFSWYLMNSRSPSTDNRPVLGAAPVAKFTLNCLKNVFSLASLAHTNRSPSLSGAKAANPRVSKRHHPRAVKSPGSLDTSRSSFVGSCMDGMSMALQVARYPHIESSPAVRSMPSSCFTQQKSIQR
mmetsp:Transcript_31585/g.60915  ORF Transcript_31585/g.60915 Transcript_31585/m.60915 type:complete len:377 (+) Transcript_31585:490-1620(+)